MLIKHNIGCVYYLKYLTCDYFNKNANDMDVIYTNVFLMLIMLIYVYRMQVYTCSSSKPRSVL